MVKVPLFFALMAGFLIENVQFGNYMNILLNWEVATGKVIAALTIIPLLYLIDIPEKLRFVGIIAFVLVWILSISIVVEIIMQFYYDSPAVRKKLTYNYDNWEQLVRQTNGNICALAINNLVHLSRKTTNKTTKENFKCVTSSVITGCAFWYYLLCI